jgi:uncharacterized protein (DUF4415 family)
MPALKPNTLLPSAEENAQITLAALSDSDAVPLTDTEWKRIKPKLRIGQSAIKKERIAVSFDVEIINAFRAKGSDWQIQMNNALKEWLKGHAAV